MAALPSTWPNITDGFGCLVVWISDTRCQGYIELQSLVKCLDNRDGFGSPYEESHILTAVCPVGVCTDRNALLDALQPNER